MAARFVFLAASLVGAALAQSSTTDGSAQTTAMSSMSSGSSMTTMSSSSGTSTNMTGGGMTTTTSASNSSETTLNLFLTSTAPGNWSASVIGACSTRTTYEAVFYPEDSELYSQTSIPYTDGPSFYEVTTTILTGGGTGTLSYSCTFDASSTATCGVMVAANADGSSTKTSSTETVAMTDLPTAQVVISAGASQLTNAAHQTCPTGSSDASSVRLGNPYADGLRMLFGVATAGGVGVLALILL